MAWLNGLPLGVGKMIVGVEPIELTSVSASPQGSGFITMPAPPPYGVSSTVRWRS